MLNEALAYLQRGWNVIPLCWIENSKCSCGNVKCTSPGKHPLTAWKKYINDRVTTNDILQWWTKWPKANIGIVTGKISDLVVRDYDDSNAPVDLFDTYTVRTGGGGVHYYFKASGDLFPTKAAIDIKVDIRGEGGYVVAPPSVHNSGGTYYVIEDVPLSEYPENEFRLVSEGSRHGTMTRQVGKWIAQSLVISDSTKRAIDYNQVWFSPPLPRYEVERIVKDLYAKEQRQKENVGPGEKLDWRVSLPLAKWKDFVFEFAGDEEDEWIIENWLPVRNIGIVSAVPGSYKSWLTLDLAFSVATGKPFLGRYPVDRRGPVVLFQQEDDFSMIARRAARIVGCGELMVINDEHFLPVPEPDPNIYVYTKRDLRAKNASSMRALYWMCEEIRPRLVVIDPLNTFVSMADYGVNASTDMAMLKAIRDTFGTSFMLVHHDGKNTSDSGRSSMYGSVFIDAFTETGWHVKKTAKDSPIVNIQRHTKLTGALNDVRATFIIEGYNYTVLADESPSFDLP